MTDLMSFEKLKILNCHGDKECLHSKLESIIDLDIENKLTVRYNGLHAGLEFQCNSCNEGFPAYMTVDLCPIKITGISSVIDGLLTSLPFSSKIFDHDGYYLYIGGESFLFQNDSLSFFESAIRFAPDKYTKDVLISDDSAVQMLARILEVRDHRDADFSYNVFGNNCGDFVQDIYSKAGFENHWLDVVHELDDYPTNLQTLYKTLSDWI